MFNVRKKLAKLFISSQNTEEPNPAAVHRTYPSVIESRKHATAYYELWRNRKEWLVRKVVQYEILDETSVQHKLSYDLDLTSVASYGLEVHDNQVVLPLDTLVKQPLLSVDLTNSTASALCLATRSENARVSCYIIVGFLISSEVPIEKIKQIELTSLFRIFQNHSTDDMARKMLVELRDASQSRANMTISESSCSWAEWVQSKEFRRLFVSLYNDYVLGVSLNLRNLSGREIVKISWNDVLNTVATRNLASLYSRIMSIVLSLWGRLGLSAATLSVVSVSVDPGFSLHAKIMIPPDIRVEDASVAPMLERKFKRKERRDLERALSKQVRIRRSGQQVTLYGGSNEDIEGIDVRIRVSPRRRVFVAPAFVSTIMSFMTMLFLYHSLKAAAFQAAKLSEQNNVALFLWSPRPASAADQIAQAADSVGGVVSTLAVLPALVASYVALRDEHDYVASLLGFRRGLLVFVSLISVFAALLANIDLSFPGVGYGTRTAITWTALLNLFALLLFLFDIVRISLWKHKLKAWVRRVAASIIFLSFIGVWCGFYFRLHDELLWGISDTWHFMGAEIKDMFSLLVAHLVFAK